ncbi:MAG: hypothetical protein L0K67_00005, partial [Brevibacterium sp.]|nr:hypothetical protein [Brevibacterium sp.]
PSGALVRLMAAYSEVLRLHGETEMADKYEELSRRTAKATGTLFGDEEPDPNLGVEIETVEEIPDEELIEPGADAADEDQAVDASDDYAADDEVAADSGADYADDEQAPATSKTHVSDKELKKVKVSDEEIEAELDELLEDAEDADANAEKTTETSADEAPAEAAEQETSLKPADSAKSEESNASYRLNGHQ